VGEAFKQVSTNVARCPNDGATAPAGTKFCPECGRLMLQLVVNACPNCGAEAKGAEFCPDCGTKMP